MEERGNRVRALVIGINKYNDGRELHYAVADATAMENTLKAYCNCTQLNLMTDSVSNPKLSPITSNILTCIDNLAKVATEEDNIIFYFSGHGDEVEGIPALLPQDYREEQGLSSSIKIEDIKNKLLKSKAKVKLLILDACHSGSIPRKGDTHAMTKSMFDALNNPPEGFVILSSCERNQKSLEDPEFKHGIFTHYLLEGINGEADTAKDGQITVNRLYEYIVPKVIARSVDKFQLYQRPNYSTNISGVYVIRSIPKLDNNGSSENYGTQLVKKIFLKTETFDMKYLDYENIGIDERIEDVLNKIEKNTILALRKTYRVAGLQKIGDTTTFKDGTFKRIIETNEDHNKVILALRLAMNYSTENWERVHNTLLEVDNLALSWKKIVFLISKKLDINKVEAFCLENEYEIIDCDPEEPQTISFETNFFNKGKYEVLVKFHTKASIISVSRDYPYGVLPDGFYTIINPQTISKLVSNWL